MCAREKSTAIYKPSFCTASHPHQFNCNRIHDVSQFTNESYEKPVHLKSNSLMEDEAANKSTDSFRCRIRSISRTEEIIQTYLQTHSGYTEWFLLRRSFRMLAIVGINTLHI